MYPPPKKSLGQNFLTDKNIVRKIVSSCGFSAGDTVVEIGSGKAEMTKMIAQEVRKVYAVEIDKRLIPILSDALKGCPNVEIINQDVLDLDLVGLAPRKKVKVVGNIPYYISSTIIAHLIASRPAVKEVYLTVQKEFAERACAAAGSKEYGSFSCFVQYYTDAKILFTIPRTCFTPAPKVDSAFLRLVPRKKLLLGPRKEKELFCVIRSSFGKRRKTMRNSLKGVVPQQRLDRFFSNFSIDPNTRPEELGLADFINLINS